MLPRRCDTAPPYRSAPRNFAVVPHIHTRFQATRIPQSKTAIRESRRRCARFSPWIRTLPVEFHEGLEQLQRGQGEGLELLVSSVRIEIVSRGI